MSEELKPCPFCGAAPKFDAMHGVWCDNDECAIVGTVFSGGAMHWNRRASLNSAQASQSPDTEQRGSEAARGVCELRNVIDCLRECGRYEDEEGESTNALDDLCALLERKDDPSSDAEEAAALRAFDQSKIDGHSFDLESYCAGHIDAARKGASE